MKTKLILGSLLAFGSLADLVAQNTSYKLNNVPISGTNNTAFGPLSLNNSTTGSFNASNGFTSLFSNSTGNNNSASGAKSLSNNTTGGDNSATGYQALNSNISGNYNSAHGSGALFTNATGNYNTAVGYNADAGSNNLSNATAIGANAVVTANNSIQLGDGNVTQIFGGTGTNATFISGGLQITGGSPAVGKVLTSNANGVATWQTLSSSGIGGWSTTGNSGTVDGTNFIGTTDNIPLSFRVNGQKSGRIDHLNANTNFGYLAGKNNAGYYNSAFGHGALESNTSGNYNSAFGYNCLNGSTSGAYNSAFGHAALIANTTGQNNSAFGYNGLVTNSTGSDNSSIGMYALVNNTTGNSNVGVGNNSLLYSISGNQNTAIGEHALFFSIFGSNNTGLGRYASVTNFTLSNGTAVGANAIVGGSDLVQLGDVNVTQVECNSGVYATTSDGRFKNNIREDEVKGLEFINLLRPVVYNFDTRKLQEFLTKDMPDSLRKKYFERDFKESSSIRHSGFIAQEVEEAAKKTGYTFDGLSAPKNEKGKYTLAYAQFVVPLVKAVQEQQKMIEDLKAEIASIKNPTSVPPNTNRNLNAISSLNVSDPGFNMDQNIPNPFTNETVINFSISQTVGNAYMAIYDLTGKQVSSIVLKERGAASVIITSEKLAAGIYIYSIVADGKIMDSKRMVVAER